MEQKLSTPSAMTGRTAASGSSVERQQWAVLVGQFESMTKRARPSMAIVIGAHSIRSGADGVSRFIMTEATVVANVIHPVQIGQFGHEPAAE